MVDIERLVVTERTLSWEAHKASVQGHILTLQGLVAKESAESYTGKDAEWKEHLVGREGFLAGLVVEAATFEQRGQEMRLRGEIR